MKLLLQRVSQAEVSVDGECVGRIAAGLLVFVGVERGDDAAVVSRMAERLLNYRVFADELGKMNRSVSDVPAAGVLLVSQFTLAADTDRGRRPSFSPAAPPAEAEALFNAFVRRVQAAFPGPVETGRFAADMQVSLVNDGPVTFLLQG